MEFRIQQNTESNGMRDIRFIPSTGVSITFSAVTLTNGSVIDGTDTFVTGSTVASNVLELTRTDTQKILQLSGGTNIQFIDNGNNSITLNAASGGGSGASVSFPWKFKEPTAAADPGDGQFRFNNTIASGITQIYVDNKTNNNIDASNFLNIIDVGDVIYIQQNDDANRAVLFTVSASTIDNTGWFTIPVQYQQGSQIPKKDKICGWIFASTGAEDNTVSNIGVGQGVFKQRNVNDFEFYSLSGGSNVNLTLNNNTIVIDGTDLDTNYYVTGGTVSGINNNSNTGTIDLTYIGVADGTYTLNTQDTYVTGSTFGSNQVILTRNDGTKILELSGGTNITLSNPSGNHIDITASGGGSFTSFNVSGDTGQETITDSNTLLLYGGEAIKTTVTATDKVTFDLDITGTTVEASPASGAKLIIYQGGEHRNIDWDDLPGAGGGETNTGISLGVGIDVFTGKTGVEFGFRSISGGTNVTARAEGGTIVLDATGGGSSRTTSTVQTTGSTPTELEKIDTLTDNATNIVEVYVKAYVSGGANWGVWKRTLTVTKVSGTVTIREENADVDKTSSGLSATSVAFAVNGGDIDVDVTGINATTIDWESAYEIIL
jgi:hypothetical protein